MVHGLSVLVVLTSACSSGALSAPPVAPHATPVGLAAATAQRDPDVPELPFPDNPDPTVCGIPARWGDDVGWVSGRYQGRLVEPDVLLYDSHVRNRVTGAIPDGTQVRVELYQANPVLDFYFVRADTPRGPQQGWVPAPFLRLSPPPS